MPPTFDTRVGAYGLIIDDERILLAHWNDAINDPGWTLPGGGLEVGEDPAAAAVREVYEETGYHVRLEGLLGLDSLHFGPGEGIDVSPRPRHSLRVIYLARISGGELRVEANGSTDDTRWFYLDEVPGLRRVGLVDAALGMWRTTCGGGSRRT